MLIRLLPMKKPPSHFRCHSNCLTADSGLLQRNKRAIDCVRRPSTAANKKHPTPQQQCPAVSYHSGSKVGHRSTCPFDWYVDTDSTRIPDKIIEQVCLRCRSCSPYHKCTQLKIPYDVIYRDTNEISRLQIRIGCVCMPQSTGSTSNSLDL